MIFPIGDDNSDRTTAPVINYLLIAINILVFVFLGQWLDRKLGTQALFTILGAFLGFGGTMWSLIRRLNRENREDEASKR